MAWTNLEHKPPSRVDNRLAFRTVLCAPKEEQVRQSHEQGISALFGDDDPEAAQLYFEDAQAYSLKASGFRLDEICMHLARIAQGNALEQLFGSTRHHERPCTGRKAASPSLVLRGAVRIVAGLGTRNHYFQDSELAPANLETWQSLRAGLERHRHTGALRQCFRRNPEVYLR